MSIKHIGNLDDMDIEDAINAFLRSALPLDDDVQVEFSQGAATIRGRVRSLTAARAIEDLVVAHDGVQYVINHLVIAPAEIEVQETRPPA